MRTRFSKLFGTLCAIAVLVASMLGAPAAVVRAKAAGVPVVVHSSGYTNLQAAADPITTTTRISVDSSGVQGNSDSDSPSVSADGRYIAFESDASNLVSDDTNGMEDIFLRDMQAGITTRVSVDSSGAQANGASSSLAMSADGQYVAFISNASNLVSGCSNLNIFLHNNINHSTTCIKTTVSLGYTSSISISNDGRWISFFSNSPLGVYLYDTLNSSVKLVSGLHFDQSDHYWVCHPSISGDGKFVVFASASNENIYDIYIYDQETDTLGLLPIPVSSGAEYNILPSISADGRYVAFRSSDYETVVSGGSIFVLDRNTGLTTSVIDSVSSGPLISADGRYVAFFDGVSDPVSQDYYNEVFVNDTKTGITTLVSADSNGIEGNDSSYPSSFSADGRYVAFDSVASNLVSGDTNGVSDAFVAVATHDLTVSKTGTGGGTVTSSPAGISCGAVCMSAFLTNTTIDLIATPGSGSHFSGWSGGGCSGTGTCTVTMDNYKAVVANFLINAKVTMTFTSTGSQDGWMLESSKGSGKGGSLNASASTFKLGDDKLNRQYRGLLSFNTTSLPDNAIIQSVVLKVKQSGGVIGSNPFSTLGSLYVDIRKGYFGSSSLLQVSDFNAAATASKVGTFGKTPVSGWYSATLNASGRSDINKTSLTQLRLYFSKATNANNKADSMNFVSGEVASARPQLIIIYTLP
jgi:hypothetical protein